MKPFPHRHRLSALPCDPGVTLEGREHLFFMRQGLKMAGQGGSAPERGPCLRAPLCPLQIRMAPGEKLGASLGPGGL